jgi:hypothetical protein
MKWGAAYPLDYPSPPHRRSCVAGDDRLAHENDARRNWPGSGHEHHECVRPSPSRSRRYMAGTKRGARSGRPGAPGALRQEGYPALCRWPWSVERGCGHSAEHIWGACLDERCAKSPQAVVIRPRYRARSPLTDPVQRPCRLRRHQVLQGSCESWVGGHCLQTCETPKPFVALLRPLSHASVIIAVMAASKEEDFRAIPRGSVYWLPFVHRVTC